MQEKILVSSGSDKISSTPREEKRIKRSSLALVLSVAFLDFLAYATIIPLIPLLILDTPYSLLAPHIKEHARYLILGSLLSTFPLAQFLGAPLIGALSDKLSRKRILTLSFFGNLIGYSFCLCGVMMQRVEGLFIGHLISGITGANVPTTNAIIADLTHQTKRTRRFSLATMTLGSAFIVGPYLSGALMRLLSEPKIAGCFIFSMAIVISLCNFLVISCFFHSNQKNTLRTVSLKSLVHDIKKILRERQGLKWLFPAVFFLYCGWYFFIKFFQVFLIQHLKLDQTHFCNILSYFGFCCLGSQVLFYVIFSRRFQEKKILLFSTGLLAVAILSFLFLRQTHELILAVTFFSFAYSLICPSLTYVVSEYGSNSDHGKIMGIYQSVQSLAKVVSPALAGLSMSVYPLAPTVISFSLLLVTALLFWQSNLKAPTPALNTE